MQRNVGQSGLDQTIAASIHSRMNLCSDSVRKTRSRPAKASARGRLGISSMPDTRHDNVPVSTILPGSIAAIFGGGVDKYDESSGGEPQGSSGLSRRTMRMNLRLLQTTLTSHLEIRPGQPKRN
jgi:hypothetical protein